MDSNRQIRTIYFFQNEIVRAKLNLTFSRACLLVFVGFLAAQAPHAHATSTTTPTNRSSADQFRFNMIAGQLIQNQMQISAKKNQIMTLREQRQNLQQEIASLGIQNSKKAAKQIRLKVLDQRIQNENAELKNLIQQQNKLVSLQGSLNTK